MVRNFGAIVGGICGGYSDGWIGNIYDCLNSGNIKVDSMNNNPMSGGIMGAAGMILNCFNSGTIECVNCDNTNRACGGICGQTYKSIRKCFTIGQLSFEANNKGDRCGILVGLIEGETMNITESYGAKCNEYKFCGSLYKEPHMIQCNDGDEFILSPEEVKQRALQNCGDIFIEDGEEIKLKMM